jgi:hypothetical protein
LEINQLIADYVGAKVSSKNQMITKDPYLLPWFTRSMQSLNLAAKYIMDQTGHICFFNKYHIHKNQYKYVPAITKSNGMTFELNISFSTPFFAYAFSCARVIEEALYGRGIE